MIKGIYNAVSGMMPRITKQDVIVNNMANANTIGYKRDRVFIEAVNKAVAKYIRTDFDWEKPMIEESFIDFSQAMIEKTENPLDIALDGRGFFVIQTDAGIRYTRNGQFHLDSVGALIDVNGNKVLSDSGPIIIENDQPVIDAVGNIEVNGEAVARLRIVDFDDPQQLSKDNGVSFMAPDGLEPREAAAVVVRQGFVERSNVSILDQMVDMISSFRNFETGQRSIQIQDETVQAAINRVGRTI